MHGKVLTISLNPSLDKTHIVHGFQAAAVHTAKKTAAVAGGKANNVARVLRTLGHAVRATGFAGGMSGQWVVQQLDAAGIETNFITVPGETRTCITIIDGEEGTTTELRERGPEVSPAAQNEWLARLPALATGCRMAVVSGSLPPGVPVEFLARVVRQLRALGCDVLLDVSGPALVAGLEARPTLIKPNEDELAELAERTGLTNMSARVPLAESTKPAEQSLPGDGEGRTTALIRIASAVSKRYGVDVVVSLGDEGAHWARADQTGLTVRPPQVRAVHAVGAGDSLVAGLVSGMMRGLSLPEALRFGVACGTASVLNFEVAVVNVADVDKLLAEMSDEPPRRQSE